MPLLFMVILPQIDRCDTVISQAAKIACKAVVLSGKRKRPDGSRVVRMLPRLS
jgi:hypothetical protein